LLSDFINLIKAAAWFLGELGSIPFLQLDKKKEPLPKINTSINFLGSDSQLNNQPKKLLSLN
jgi:hypothetical protein